MTKVYAQKSNGNYLIRAKGHASGSVEVCAAVSAVMYALGGYLQNSTDKVSDVGIRLESADAEISFKGNSEAEAVFMLTVIGLLQIEASNGEFLSIEFEEK